MFEWFLIGGGIFFLIIAILFALPGLGLGLVIPVVGDALDVPIATVMAVIGMILLALGLILGGLGYFISQFWWLIPLILVVWIAVIYVLKFAKKALK